MGRRKGGKKEQEGTGRERKGREGNGREKILRYGNYMLSTGILYMASDEKN